MDAQQILVELKTACLRKLIQEKKKATDFTGPSFEDFVADVATSIFDDVEHYQDGTFPDLRVEKTGIEIKMRQNGAWNTVGNSIKESSQAKKLESTYVFFLRFADEKPEIRFAKYDDCVSGIAITHSPRYTIDMEQEPSDSIFVRSGVKPGDEFKLKMQKFVQHYKANGLKLGWLDLFIDPDNTPSSSAILSTIPKAQEDTILAELLALCPEIYDEDYTQASMRLITAHNTLIHNLRDFFSAGGKMPNPLKNSEKIPRKDFNTFCLAKKIAQFLKAAKKELLQGYWGKEYVSKMSPVENWLKIIDDQKVKELFLAGLKS